MAVSPIIANTVEVRLLWAFNGQGAINVLHATAPAGTAVNQALANALGTPIKAAFTSNLAPLMTAGNSLVRVGVRDLRVAAGAEFLDVGALVTGSGVGDNLPQYVALCVTLRTASAGKSFRGRIYYGGFNEAQNDTNGNALAAVSTAVVAFTTAVQAAMTANQLTFAVASRPAERYTVVRTTFHNDGSTTAKTITQGPARPGGSTPVTSIAVRSARWETQRRRTNSRGAPPTLLTNVAEHTF